ncbi:phage GP46 family protein [Rhizosaccharibacter radicis]|uniref:Phage GP46 family protein n=1 Tax=Rhizosaccharibacter radicis TaxID=2782605 RepID=A0ABT1VVZ2_9PROT|nr:phage GP46 family protein [Acetobacteraceae bacterium KSS12]
MSMGQDIAITWDVLRSRGDWSVAGGDLATGNALLSAVMVSLLTDRVAPATPTPADQAAGLGTPAAGTQDRRGWWGDAYAGVPIGSRLWQLKRAIKSNRRAVPQEAEDMCREALQWLLDDGIAASVTPTATWAGPTTLRIAVQIVKPDGATETASIDWAWEGL